MATKFSFNADLVDDIARRKVVLFVGAGASKWAKPKGGGNFKGWSEFLTHACSQLTNRRTKQTVKDCISNKDYLIASELLKSSLQERWNTLLENEFQQAADVSRLHKALISLDQRIVVTTNFDKLIETAWNASSPARYPHVITEVDQRAFKLFRNQDPYLIKIHGSIDTPESIIFDKSSYQRNAFSNLFYRELISTLLLTHTFVFIGFSMDDPAVTWVVESHAYRFFDTRPHYIFASGKPNEQLDGLSRTLRKLFVLRYPDKNDHAALAEQLDELGQQAQTRRRQIQASL